MNLKNSNRNFYILLSLFVSFLIFIFILLYFIFLDLNTPLKSKILLGQPFSLTTHEEIEITDKIFLQKPSIMFFGFTHCPEVCPTTLYEISTWLNKLEKNSDKVQAIFITLDPKRDTAKFLNEYLSNFDDMFIGITGSEDEIISLAKSWGVYRKIIYLEDDEYSIDHTATVFLVNKDGSLNGTITYREPFEIAFAKIKNLLNTNK